MLSYSIGKDSITLFIDGDLANVDSSHRNYAKLREELLKPEAEQNIERIKQLSTIQAMLKSFAGGAIELTESEMRFEGKPVTGHIVDKILELIHEEGNADPYVNFFLNLQKNPNKNVASDVFKWCERGKMPITPDGYIIGFKKVRKDYKDVHSGQFDNSPGSILAMPREKCDPSRSNTCSTGFHFCSASYLNVFSGERVMAVKVNPADVTAIPNDYNNAKGRCCRYEVVEELSSQSAAQHDVWSTAVKDLENPQEFPDEFFAENQKPKRKAAKTTKAGNPKKEKVKSEAPAVEPKKIKVVSKKPKASTPEAKAVDKQFKAAVKKVTQPKPKAADVPETVKEIVKSAVTKGKQPKPTKAPTPVFVNKTGGSVHIKDIRNQKKLVERKVKTHTQAAVDLNTSPSTLRGWFSKV